ncbi:hypothetical protein GUJ93_ZPchr0011g26962 [Zizania palustris]|uniref:Uncharacterized protein n=1 Tax=Zizania palustris TaxID=103762 RepID=A0A8J5WHT2_ZIZPA|nr:hypothetical protein GUJ93_ZPchr0011g26962 [Zizania palustris]
MLASDKQLASVNKLASHELPNKGANIVNMSQGTSSLPKDKGPATDPGRAVGTKRLQTDAPSSPGYHNVYVRRKVESDHSKINSSQEKGNGRDKTKELDAQQNVQHDQTNNPELSSPVAESGSIVSPKSPEKTNEEIVLEKNYPPVASSTTAVQDDTHKSSNQYWNERFNRLQTYLENCEQSTQEGYMRGMTSGKHWYFVDFLYHMVLSTFHLTPVLRSLSAAGRSMHAIELEKRAIHLLVEEGDILLAIFRFVVILRYYGSINTLD